MEGDEKPSVDIDICPGGNSLKEGCYMTAYEGVKLVIGILGLLITMIGIIVKLIIAYIDAKK